MRISPPSEFVNYQPSNIRQIDRRFVAYCIGGFLFCYPLPVLCVLYSLSVDIETEVWVQLFLGCLLSGLAFFFAAHKCANSSCKQCGNELEVFWREEGLSKINRRNGFLYVCRHCRLTESRMQDED
jgi:hypothetical protein